MQGPGTWPRPGQSKRTTTTPSPRGHGIWAHTLPCLLVKWLLVLQEWPYTCLLPLATPLCRDTLLLKCSTLDQVLLLFVFFFFLFLHTVWNFCSSTDKLQYREVLVKHLAFSSHKLSWVSVTQLLAGASLVFELWKSLLPILNSTVQASPK